MINFETLSLLEREKISYVSYKEMIIHLFSKNNRDQMEFNVKDLKYRVLNNNGQLQALVSKSDHVIIQINESIITSDDIDMKSYFKNAIVTCIQNFIKPLYASAIPTEYGKFVIINLSGSIITYPIEILENIIGKTDELSFAKDFETFDFAFLAIQLLLHEQKEIKKIDDFLQGP